MRRIRDRRENESMDNAHAAFDNYSRKKHYRDYVQAFEADLEHNLQEIVRGIQDESWMPKGYTDKVIVERKRRTLALAPIEDHVTEATAIRPYEKALYDYSSWRAPAVKPGLGTHALMRFLRNEMFRYTQDEMAYDVLIDAHLYFPLMDHEILKRELDRVVKPGKLRRFLDKVIDSYLNGAPLGIKIAQLYGQIYLARFDRLAMNFFNIGDDPDKLAYWTQRYVTDRIATARTQEDYRDLCRGPSYLARKFQAYVEEGLPFYFRFVDGILFRHEDKTALHIILELAIMYLSRDWHVTVNEDYNVRPCRDGIRMVGYVFYHEKVAVSKRHKKELAKRVRRLQKLGFTEEQIRVKLASRFGFVKHANCINLLKKLGMEKSLGKIIKNRRVRPPFEGMSGKQKVKFSSVIGQKILLIDYMVTDSKIDKAQVMVQLENSEGGQQYLERSKPNKALAIRFKKILRTFESEGAETYVFEKTKDEEGNPTTVDAEFYSFSGSKILIDQAMNDFTVEDLPAPTVIQQFQGKNGQTFVKFT